MQHKTQRSRATPKGRCWREQRPGRRSRSRLPPDEQEAIEGAFETANQEGRMRSELIFKAIAHVPNRYLLVRLLAKGTRKMHKPNTRVEDTTNLVLGRFHGSGARVGALRSEPEQMEDRRA